MYLVAPLISYVVTFLDQISFLSVSPPSVSAEDIANVITPLSFPNGTLQSLTDSVGRVKNVLGVSHSHSTFIAGVRVLGVNTAEKIKSGEAESVSPNELLTTASPSGVTNEPDDYDDELEEESCASNISLCDSVKKLNEIHSFLHGVASKYLGLAKLKVIGKSFENRSIYALEIHNGNAHNCSTIVVEFGIHAREWASPASAVYLINELFRERGSLTSSIKWIIIPVLNPDGYHHSTTVNNMWRKNRRLLPSSKCLGVDLNRNFGTGWDKVRVADPCAEDYAGKNSFSEPESRVMRDYIISIGPEFIDAYIAVHSCAQSVLHPYGYKSQAKLGELAKVKEAGRKMAKAMTSVRNFEHPLKPAYTLGIAGGGSDDYMFEHFSIPLVFTVELGDASFYDDMDYHRCFHPHSPREMYYLSKECYSGLRELALHLMDEKITKPALPADQNSWVVQPVEPPSGRASAATCSCLPYNFDALFSLANFLLLAHN